MKAVDTPVLVDLLCGSRAATSLIGSWKDEEVATTEINLGELQILAEEGPQRGLAQRTAALHRLRRRLTVLPIDSHAIAALARLPSRSGRLSPTTRLIAAALVANGCSEWHTVPGVAASGALGPLKVVEYTHRTPKKRK